MTKILIVDDEPALRFAVHEALEAHGLDVVAAETATEAPRPGSATASTSSCPTT